MEMNPFVPTHSSLVPANSWQIHDPFRSERGAVMPFTQRFQHEISKPLAPLMTADLIESPNDYTVHVDLPGVEDLDISIRDRVLCMKAERKAAHEVENDVVHSFERSYGKVQRKILLPINADAEHAQAKFKNGVLTVTFPKVGGGEVKKLTIL